eukprot:c9855_g1_i1.p1 GENE.c9855_g1_i1~~c9855_g1_i1.p1  ORF type:complete len:672 (+),score=194.88 c9855_g1_i1:133-2148(+)
MEVLSQECQLVDAPADSEAIAKTTTTKAKGEAASSGKAKVKQGAKEEGLEWMTTAHKRRIEDAFTAAKEEVKCEGKVLGEVSLYILSDDWLKNFVREFLDSDQLWRKEAKIESTELLMVMPTLKTKCKALAQQAKKARATIAQALAKDAKKKKHTGTKEPIVVDDHDADGHDDDDNQDATSDVEENNTLPAAAVQIVLTSEIANHLLADLEKENKEVMDMVEQMKIDGMVSYNLLWSVFQVGDIVVSTDDNHSLIGGEVTTTRYQRSCWCNQFNVDITMIKINTSGMLQTTKQSLSVPAFRGTRKVASLTVRPMDSESMDELTARGRMFERVATGSHFMSFKGAIIQRSWWSTQMHRADGRVMVDTMTHKRMNPSYSYTVNNDTSRTLSAVPEDKLYSTWPTVPGFAFTAKKWGELAVDKLTEVKFDEDAFERLVLDQEKKTLIQALVENQHAAVSDIISGKGGGCIFLLHGPPGTGKTLTAEAIAELLHRPLYSVSVGELGTSTTELEKSLRDILEVATTWNAVILIDEADIFLERRTENDIVRNAMVGIFLRLLEYHQGVLFLTTNRVRCFDEAFHSRISVALHYEALTELGRASVWKNFLDKAGIKEQPGLYAEELGKFELNGRQIKNTIRLAQALASSEGIPLQSRHVQRTIDVARQFQQDILTPSQ